MKSPNEILDLMNKNQTSKADLVEMAMAHLPKDAKLEKMDDIKAAMEGLIEKAKAPVKSKEFRKITLLRKYVPAGTFVTYQGDDSTEHTQPAAGLTQISAKAGQVIGVDQTTAENLVDAQIAKFNNAK